jgi:F-type H+-transporting ATPase subunit b
MDATLHALSAILLKAVPTFVLVIALNFYLKFVFFKPLEKVLKERYDATEGARQLAEASMERAAARTGEYEAALRTARGEASHAREKMLAEVHEAQAAQLAAARQRAAASVAKARAELAGDAATAAAALERESDALAEQIVQAVLRRSAA